MKFYKHVNSFLGSYYYIPQNGKMQRKNIVKNLTIVVVVTELAKNELMERIKLNKEKVLFFSNSVSKSFYIEYKFDNAIIKKYSNSFVLLIFGNTSKRRGLKTVLNSIPEIMSSLFLILSL